LKQESTFFLKKRSAFFLCLNDRVGNPPLARQASLLAQIPQDFLILAVAGKTPRQLCEEEPVRERPTDKYPLGVVATTVRLRRGAAR